jgi:hypothetical protein
VLAFLACASALLPADPRKHAGLACFACVGAAYLAAAAFPCDPGCPREGSLAQSVHNVFGFFEYAGALIGLALLSSVFRSSPVWRPLAPQCLACALALGVGFGAMLLPALEPLRGASQRLAEIAIFFWVGCVGVWLLRES